MDMHSEASRGGKSRPLPRQSRIHVITRQCRTQDCRTVVLPECNGCEEIL